MLLLPFRINAFLLCTSYAVSMLSLVLVSCYRYIKVCHPRVFHTVFTTRRNPFYCLVLWVLAAATNLPLFWLEAHYGYDRASHLCNARGGRTHPCFGNIATLIVLLMPLFLISFFNAAIFRQWHASHRKLLKRMGRVRMAKTTRRRFLSMSMSELGAIGLVNNDDSSRESNDSRSGVVRRQGESFSDVNTSSFMCPAASEQDSDNTGEATIRRVSSGRRLSKHRLSTVQGSRDDNTAEEKTSHTKGDLQSGRGEADEEDAGTPSSAVSMRSRNNTRFNKGQRRQRTISAADCSPDVAAALKLRQMGMNRSRTLKNPVASSRKTRPSQSVLLDALDLKETKFSHIDFDISSPDVSVQEDVDIVEDGTDLAIFAIQTNVEDTPAEEANRNSEPVDLNVPQKADRCEDKKRKQSLYPSIDRTRLEFSTWRRRRAMAASRKRQKPPDLALVRSLLVISVCIFLFYAPFIVNIVLTFVLKDDVPAELPVTATLLLLANCGINWIIYGVMNTAIRQAYVTTLRSCACCVLVWRSRASSHASSIGPAAHRSRS